MVLSILQTATLSYRLKMKNFGENWCEAILTGKQTLETDKLVH
jgi:hypothetical protein